MFGAGCGTITALQASLLPPKKACSGICCASILRKTRWVKTKRSPDVELIRAPPKPHTRVGETRKCELCKKRADFIHAILRAKMGQKSDFVANEGMSQDFPFFFRETILLS
jgi:hypothetical protein